jgi:hypothetical protein
MGRTCNMREDCAKSINIYFDAARTKRQILGVSG